MDEQSVKVIKIDYEEYKQWHLDQFPYVAFSLKPTDEIYQVGEPFDRDGVSFVHIQFRDGRVGTDMPQQYVAGDETEDSAG